MSHFAVLVIGENVEQQLAPYHEFECTGCNDQYVQDVDITDDVREQMTGDEPDTLVEALEYYGLEKTIVANESEVQKDGDDCPHKWGYAIVQDGQLIKAVRRTNPNKKWDWWQVGGRWSGFLKLKPGSVGEVGSPGLLGSCAARGPDRADQALKKDIDFDGMRNDAGVKAAERWDKAKDAKVAAGFAEDSRWDAWVHVRDVLHPGDIEAARTTYHAQPVKDAVSKAFDNPWDGVDEYLTPRDEYIQQARDRATVLYAVVKDGEWIAKGEMGWFGMSDDKDSQSDWNRKVNELLDSLPDDTPITVVDCHI
ncbi:MAG TPA: hypothetical protein VFW49_14950 [Fluviicoccus sp.]|nr:hypothetical protein [Fluviicoccus sp.]